MNNENVESKLSITNSATSVLTNVSNKFVNFWSGPSENEKSLEPTLDIG